MIRTSVFQAFLTKPFSKKYFLHDESTHSYMFITATKVHGTNITSFYIQHILIFPIWVYFIPVFKSQPTKLTSQVTNGLQPTF